MAAGPLASLAAARLAPAVRVFIVAAPIYFVWEMAQAPLFTGMPRDWRLATMFCALATIGDVIVLVALVSVGSFLFRNERWFTPPQIGRYTTIALVSLAAQMAIEWLGVEKLHLWGYQPWHPRLPLVATGLVPLLQPLVVVPSALWLASRWEARASPQRRRDSL
ncbi:MAG: hypothetical protein E6J87_16705 [Deltaproteobacteria bacterium]|nr:MAG: hypothetical protein E6J87_16705 [Deltaproteobacteria bacterium]